MNIPHEMVYQFAKLMGQTKQKNWHKVMLDVFVEWNGASLPDDVAPGAKKSCFETCQKRSAWEGRKDLIYCEGFASSENLSIPMMHAWLMRPGKKTTEIIDPVWRAGQHEYFGITIPSKIVVESIARTKTWGSIIENGYLYDLAPTKK